MTLQDMDNMLRSGAVEFSIGGLIAYTAVVLLVGYGLHTLTTHLDRKFLRPERYRHEA